MYTASIWLSMWYAYIGRIPPSIFLQEYIYSNSSNRCVFNFRPPFWSPAFPVWAGLPFRTLPVGFTLHRFWFHRRCPRMRSEAHTKCLCWIVPGSRATFSASCTIFGEIQRSHSPTDDGRDRARFLYNGFDKRADEF